MILKQFSPGGIRVHGFRSPIVIIGRAPDSDIVLCDAKLPEVAIKLENRSGENRVENVNRDKRVLLNGKPFKTAVLKPGDRLEAGLDIFIADRDHQLVDSETERPKKQESESGPALLFQQSLLRFAREAGVEKDLSMAAKKILKVIMDLTGGTEAILFTLSQDGNPKVAVASGLKDPEAHFSDTIIQDVLNSGKGVAIPNTLTHEKYSGTRSIVDLKLRTVLCTPILLAGKTIGLIYLGCRKGDVSYSPSDLESLNAYALIAGMIIHNVDYISQQRESIRHLARARETGLVAQSPAMKKVLDRIQPVAGADISVLLQGETGTGKDVIAEYIHKNSGRAEAPFVAVNCSSLQGELLESELFGHKKGAFTGAVSDKHGLFQAAGGGSLFLDEVGEMGPALQARLLRVLETGKVRPVGDVEEVPIDVRVLSATNRNLAEMVKDGSFREDLYYRLAQITVQLPPLRERGEDILLLAYYFLEQFRARYPQREIRDFHPQTIEAFMTHEWPGNVRELLNLVHRSILTSTSSLIELDSDSFQHSFASLEEATKRFQKNYLSRALALAGGNREAAAKLLGMSRSSFFRYLSQLGAD